MEHRKRLCRFRPFSTITPQVITINKKLLNPNEFEQEILLLKGIVEILDTMLNKMVFGIYGEDPDGNPVFNSITRTVAISAGERMYLFQVNGADRPIDYITEDLYKFEIYIEYQSLQGHKLKVNWNHPIYENFPERRFIGKPIKL